MPDWTLAIDALGPDAGWRVAWVVDGKPAFDQYLVQCDAVAAVVDAGKRFRDLFEQRNQFPRVEPEVLRAIGRLLFQHFFKPAWRVLQPTLSADHGRARGLLIRSAAGGALNLPWELVELTPEVAVGCDPLWSVRRTSLNTLSSASVSLDAGPLRVLFLAAAPIDQAHLDYEGEEDAMLRATASLREDVEFFFSESGSFDEFDGLVAEHRPHMIHLSGHGAIQFDGIGTFAFEDERGRTDSRCAADIARAIFRSSSVRCVFLNACHSSQAAAAGLCQELTGAGVAMAIGWAASVADDMATEFSETFYRRLLLGEAIPAAAANARRAIQNRGFLKEGTVRLQDATFALPQAYCSTVDVELLDRAAPPRPRTLYRNHPTLLGDGIKGLREGFVGRRRAIQKLVPALRDGDITFAVIWGLGGAGKSTLATRVANRLEAENFSIIPIRAESKKGRSPAKCGRAMLSKIIDALDAAFLAKERVDLHNILLDARIPQDCRLRMAIDGLRELRLLLVLDNFEDVLNLKTVAIADPELAEFYAYLSRHLTDGSRVIVTCRFLPADTPADAANVLALPLGDFEEHDFLKFLRRDPKVDERLRRNELSQSVVLDLFRKVGGTPGFLASVRHVLRTIDPNKLREELSGDGTGRVSKAQQAYYERIVLRRLYAALPLPAQRAASRIALSEHPLPLDAIAQITRLDAEAAKQFLAPAVALGLLQQFAEEDVPTLYHPPGLLCPWLSDAKRVRGIDVIAVHARLAAFWRAIFESRGEAELRMRPDAVLLACRAHARSGQDATAFRWATVRLARILERQARWLEVQELLGEIPEADRDPECLVLLATLEYRLGHLRQAKRHFTLALPLLPDSSGALASAWNNLASIDMKEGEFDEARKKLAVSLAIQHYINESSGEVAVWQQLATIDVYEGKYSEARKNLAMAMAIRNGDPKSDAGLWHLLASIDMAEADPIAARQNLDKALVIRTAIVDRAGEAESLHQVGTIELDQGNFREARQMFNKSLEIKRTIGDRPGEIQACHQLAVIDVHEGSYGAARQKFGEAMAIARAVGDWASEPALWSALGALAHNMGRSKAGLPLLVIGWMLHRRIGHSDAAKDFERVLFLCNQLGYNDGRFKERFETILAETTQAYKRDGGQSLLLEAFPNNESPHDSPTSC